MTETTKATHTPGPWVARFTQHEWVVSSPVAGEYGQRIAITNDGDRGQDSNEANAHLIAAAPDLLAACQEAVNIRVPLVVAESLGGSGISEDLASAYAHMRAAIAKAVPND